MVKPWDTANKYIIVNDINFLACIVYYYMHVHVNFENVNEGNKHIGIVIITTVYIIKCACYIIMLFFL